MAETRDNGYVNDKLLKKKKKKRGTIKVIIIITEIEKWQNARHFG